MKGALGKIRRNGHMYCGSGCGRGCTWAEYQAAVNAADKLAKRLGPKWRPVVWENLGWYHEAQFGPDETLQVHGDHGHPQYYWANFRMFGIQFHAGGTTPEKALVNVWAELRRQLSRLKTMYRFLEKF